MREITNRKNEIQNICLSYKFMISTNIYIKYKNKDKRIKRANIQTYRQQNLQPVAIKNKQKQSPTHSQPMSSPTHNIPKPSNQQTTQERELQQLYAYYDHRSPPKQQQPQGHSQEHFENGDQFLYNGCDYDANLCRIDFSLDQWQQQGLGSKYKNQLFYADPQQQQRSFTLQYKQNQYQTYHNSQPTAVNRQHRRIIPQINQLSANSSLSNPTRSVNALVSAQKNKIKIHKAPSKATSLKSISSSVSTRNKLILQHKEKKKNGDKTIEPVFFNPLESLPFQAMDVQGFKKMYQTSHQQIFEVIVNQFKKINEIQKNIIILGQKAFFKDKQNQQNLDQIFKLMGFKTSSKMGKGKSFREFRAIYKYLNMENLQISGDQNKYLGDGARMINSSYLSQFKDLMGYKENQEEKQQASENSFLGYGFGKLQRKR